MKTFNEIIDVSTIQRLTALTFSRGKWYIAGADIADIVRDYGTPVFVNDLQKIKSQCSSFINSFKDYKGDVHPFFAVKASSCSSIIDAISRSGFGVDVVSVPELITCLKLGIRPNQILMNGNAKTDAQLQYVISQDIEVIIADCKDELDQLNAFSAEQNKKTNIAIRVNFDDIFHSGTWNMSQSSSKFGVSLQESINLFKYVYYNLDFLIPTGIHFHLGSQLSDASLYLDAIRKVFSIFVHLQEALQINLKFIDIGGGFPIPSLIWSNESGLPPDSPSIKELKAELDISQLGTQIATLMNELVEAHNTYPPQLYLEPGRYVTMSSGVLVTKIQTVKTSPHTQWISLDAGCHTLQDCWIYKWFFECLPLATDKYADVVNFYNIAGPLCDSGDILGWNRELPSVKRGDILMFLQVGGYHVDMQSSFHLFPRAAHVVIENNVIRFVQHHELYASQNNLLTLDSSL
jgi:diaminopimelate decarboxylase